MQVAYIDTTCHCDEQGFAALVWDEERNEMRYALPGEDPILRIRCSDCGGTTRCNVAVLLDHEPVESVNEDAIEELLAELTDVREQIHREEATRPYVDPSLMQRHDQLSKVEELCDFEDQITMLEQHGVAVMPGLLKHREELRATVRGLLPVAA